MTPIRSNRCATRVTRLLPLQWQRLDLSTPFLLSPCRETAALDRYFEGARQSVCWPLLFVLDLIPTWRASDSSLKQPCNGPTDETPASIVQNISVRFPI